MMTLVSGSFFYYGEQWWISKLDIIDFSFQFRSSYAKFKFQFYVDKRPNFLPIVIFVKKQINRNYNWSLFSSSELFSITYKKAQEGIKVKEFRK